MNDWGFGFDEPTDEVEKETITCDRCGSEEKAEFIRYVLGKSICDNCWERLYP